MHPSRVHLDIETDTGVARLEKLGAKIVKRFKSWVVMEAASGHRFCPVNSQLPGFGERATSWND